MIIANFDDVIDALRKRNHDARAERCTEIANEVCGGPPENCTSQYAKRWQAAWDAACVALRGDPADYRIN